MSQAPETSRTDEERDSYLSAFAELAQRIRDGASFSGRERHCAFLNTGQGSFADISALSGFGMPSDGRGLAVTDWDHDGDLDLWLSNRSAPRLQFLQNRIPPPESGWISFRLQGNPSQSCPRDGIGSQVELVLPSAGKRRVKTLHAGNGLMSQSSKWLHFGLGSEERNLSTVRVRWAGGMSEEFKGITAGHRWRLVQGSGQALPTPAREKISLSPGKMPLALPTEVARIRLSQPLKIPDLNYLDFNGKERSINQLADQNAVFLNLWATWCAPCAAELEELEKARSEFAEAGIEIVALNVDQLGPDSQVTPSKAAAALRKFGFQGAGGLAEEELISRLEQSILASVYRHHRMPVPVSFLIDRGGWLSAIYKGPVEVGQILADRRELGKSPEAALAAAVPFRGTWARSHFPGDPMTISAASLEGGYRKEAQTTLLEYLNKHQAPPGNPEVPEERTRNMQLGQVYFQLGEIARLEKQQVEARSSYLTSLRYNKRQLPVLNRLAWLLATSSDPAVRDGPGALGYATFMMQAPGIAENPGLLGTLAAAQAAAGNFPAAIETTTRIIGILESRQANPEAEIHRKRLTLFQQGNALTVTPGQPAP